MTTSRTKTGGFTFLELLVVMVLITILSVMIGPSLTGGDVARVKAASRGVMQMSRYARTMAVLRQQTMMLEIGSDGKLRVVPKGGASRPEPSVPSAEQGGGDVESDAGPEESEVPQGGEMAEAETFKEYKQISFRVELDEDRLQDEEEGGEIVRTETDSEDAGAMETVKSAAIPYAGNGRCLPYYIIISPTDGKGGVDEGGWKLRVSVDRFGNAKILDEDGR
ncbi:MAG: prepilin-type N-terminal cleavage/methylation domain-containing protein [Kiritimatiellae bacterium]|nr:prepilin-type N-terminal cleavage/methylation domain-containing protein [Kiritimatiellia bacterium]